MSETIEAPPVVESDALTDRYAGAEFGSEADAGQQQEDDAPPPPKPEPETKTEPDEPKWYVKRIGSITAQRKLAEERAEKAERELDEYRRALAEQRGETQPAREQTPDQIRAEERQRVATESAERERVAKFNTVTQTLAQAVAKDHGDGSVQTATQALISKAGMDFANANHRQVIEDISELPNAGAVYYALANDPDAASELFEAPERKQFAMLQRFASSVEMKAAPATPEPAPQPRQISRTPAPVAAASGSGRAVSSRSIYDGDLSMDDYIKLRSKK